MSGVTFNSHPTIIVPFNEGPLLSFPFFPFFIKFAFVNRFCRHLIPVCLPTVQHAKLLSLFHTHKSALKDVGWRLRVAGTPSYPSWVFSFTCLLISSFLPLSLPISLYIYIYIYIYHSAWLSPLFLRISLLLSLTL